MKCSKCGGNYWPDKCKKNTNDEEQTTTNQNQASNVNTVLNSDQEKTDPEVTKLVNLINNSSIIGTGDWDRDFNAEGLSFMSYGHINSKPTDIKTQHVSIDLEKLAKNPKLVASYAQIVAQSGGKINPWWALLDSQSTVYVFSNPKLLKQIQRV